MEQISSALWVLEKEEDLVQEGVDNCDYILIIAVIFIA